MKKVDNTADYEIVGKEVFLARKGFAKNLNQIIADKKYKNNYILAMLQHVGYEFAVLDTHTIEFIILTFEIFTQKLADFEKEKAELLQKNSEAALFELMQERRIEA
jgi:hypothetical protein